MEAFFLRIVNMSIAATYLVLAVMAVRLVFRNAPRWLLCALWGMVAFRLICPFSLESALSLIPSAQPLPREIIHTAHPAIDSGIPGLDAVVNPVLETSLTPKSPANSVNPTQIWSFLLAQLWVLGMILMFLYALVSYLRIHHKVATAIPISKGVKRSEFMDTPFLLGLLRPIIYLPASMEAEDMPYVVAHERSHIRRRDHWWKPLGFLLLSIYWFNPVMWIAYVLLCRDIEAACDEKVIRDLSIDGRRAYSTALLNCSIRRSGIAACPLAFGEVGVKDRVKAVMSYKKPAFWLIATALALSCVTAVCFLTDPERAAVRAVEVTPHGLTLECRPKGMAARLEIQSCQLEYDDHGQWKPVVMLGLRKEVSSQGTSPILFIPNEKGWTADWSVNYGILLPGRYRIGLSCRDSVTGEDQELDSEFTVTASGVYMWKNIDNDSLQTPRENEISIRVPGRAGITLDDSSKDGIWTLRNKQTGEALFSDTLRSTAFADLNGDGVCEVYAIVNDDGGTHPRCYDPAAGQTLGLPEDDSDFHTLVAQEDCLFLVKRMRPENALHGVPECYQLSLTAKGLEALPLKQEHQPLTREITGIRTVSRIATSLNPQQVSEMIKLLHELEGHVKPASPEEFAQAQTIPLNIHSFEVSYALGFRVLNMSQDYAMMWEDGSEEGYILSDPEPLRSFLTQLADGVPERGTGGLPFATEEPSALFYTVGGEYTWQMPVLFQYGDFSLKLNLIDSWVYEQVPYTAQGHTGIRCRPRDVNSGWIYFSYWPDGYAPEETDRFFQEIWNSGKPTYVSYPSFVETPEGFNTRDAIWSYQRTALAQGDYAVINQGAGPWFLEYTEQIHDTVILAEAQYQ